MGLFVNHSPRVLKWSSLVPRFASSNPVGVKEFFLGRKPITEFN